MTKVNPYSAPDADLARPQQYGELKVLSARGRLGRLRYLAYSFAIGLAGNAITVGLVAALGPMTHSGGMAVLVIAPISIFLLVVSFFLIIQRLHDSCSCLAQRVKIASDFSRHRIARGSS
jgi:uncharacterized membrane protein